jgi:Ser/Thr protein kinase RdoA (MazF antagonist)
MRATNDTSLRFDDQARLPTFSLPTVSRIAKEQFGVQGELTEMLSERDQVFKLNVDGQDKYVMRLSDEQESLAAIECQNRALLRLGIECPEISVPQPCESVNGRLWERVHEAGRSHCVRLFAFVIGEPVAGRSLSPPLLEDIGRSLALVDKGLNGLARTGCNDQLIFNVHRMERLRPLASYVEGGAERRLVEEVFGRLHQCVLERLSNLRRQIIHNDLNRTNILIDPRSPDRVSGIIDFGDLLEAALIVDLAVAVARQVGFDATIESASRMVRGYDQVVPLMEDEIGILFDVICARLAMRAVIWSWRKRRRHPRYHSGRIGDSLNLLAHWKGLGERMVTATFREVLER